MAEEFEIIGVIEEIATIAVGSRIRERARLRKVFGAGRWRKLKGVATVRFEDGTIHRVEGALVRGPRYWTQETKD